jgi:hypothetical protein
MTHDDLEFLLADDFGERQDTLAMVPAIRAFMVVEAAAFAGAALIHWGLLLVSYAHREAAIAESVIFLALVLGLALTWIHPAWTRTFGVVAQSFALAGTLAGIFFIAIDLGPRTAADIGYHVGIGLVLATGVITAARSTPA